MHKKTVYFSLLSFYLLTLSCFGSTVSDIYDNYYDDTSRYIKNTQANKGIFNPVDYASFKGYKGDGSFVEAPAHVGDWSGYIIGVLPAILITEPFRLLSIDRYEGNNIGEYILYGTTKTFGCLFGGPSFILKGIFWDLPIWIFGGQSDSRSSVEHEIKPAAPVVKKQKEEKTPVYHYDWNSKQIKPPLITSISAKPSMLKKSKIPAEKPITEVVVKKEKSVMTKQFIDSQIPVADEITKKDETLWDSPPPLPDWVKKEMDN